MLQGPTGRPVGSGVVLIPGSHTIHSMRRVLLVAAAVLVVGVVGTLTWYVVDWRTGLDQVAPNVTLDGRSVGLMTPDELTAAIGQRAEEIGQAPVTVEFTGGTISATAAEAGVSVDTEATFDAVMAAGRDQGFVGNLISWARGPWRPRSVDSVWGLPVDGLADFLATHPGALVAVPVEPTVVLGDDGFEVVPGTPGARLDADEAADILGASYEAGQAVSVSAPVLDIAPDDTNQAASALAERLSDLTDGGVSVQLLGTSGRISERSLQENLSVEGPVSNPEITLDAEGLQAALLRLFGDVSQPGTDPVFEADGDEVPTLVTPGSAPRGCCGADSGSIVVDALERQATGPVIIPPAEVGDETLEDWASGGGIVEVVGTFTTNHDCCEARVDNIHRIADLIRGQYLLPGESFSVNEFVGERTTEKGFVPAGVIERGRFTQSVGGGISQFATTMFNAAFFAGLDLDEYQSHSIYISRYPYGREATLSFPQPDLKVTNSTHHPVLIWPTYTGSSITVTLYSTQHIEVEETGQEESAFGQCTEVETFRSRTYPDGEVVEDSVKARYRPGEGLDCNGNPTPQP
jgi:vancomycin resistance protein YoaR